MDHIYQTQEIHMKKSMESLNKYTWTVPIQLAMDNHEKRATEVKITMTRTQVDNNWTSWKVERVIKWRPSYLSA